MSTPDEKHPDSTQFQSAGGAPPLLESTTHSDAPVAGQTLLPKLQDDRVADRAFRPAILYAAPKPVDLLRALQRRWLLASFLAVLFAVPAALIAFFTIPVTYRAESWLRARRSTLIYKVEKGTSSWNTHAQLTRSFFVLNAALSQPGVSELPWIQEIERQGNDPVDWYAEKLSVDVPDRRSGASGLLRISMTGDDPVQLQLLVQAATDAYLDRVVNAEKQEALKRRDMIEQSYFKKAEEVRKKREDMHRLAREIGTASSAEAAAQQTLLADYVLRLRQQVGQYRQQKFFKEYELRSFIEKYRWDENKNRIPSDLIDRIVAEDTTVQELDKAIYALNEKIRHLEDIVRDKNSRSIRERRQAVAHLEKDRREHTAVLRAGLAEKLRNGAIRTKPQELYDNLTTELARVSRIYEDLQQEYVELSADINKLNKYSADLSRRREELDHLRKITNTLGFELEKLQLELSAGGERIELIQKARHPRSRNSAKRDKMTLMAACAGMALAVCGTSLFEFHFRRVTSGDDMANGLGLKVLGNVPLLSERRWHLRRGINGTRVDDLQGIMDESVDGIRAMLLHSPVGESVRTLLVTSAKAGEGKTTVAGALAASMGRSGRRTLLVDGDLRRPSVHRLLDMPIDSGLAEVLRGEASLEDVIRPSPAAGLWFMSAGQCDQVALQALTKEGVGEIFEKLRSEFDFVIVDSGPAMSIVDPLLLSQHCDGAVISVVRRVSQIPAVYETCERFTATGVPIIGCIVNGLQASPFTPGYYSYSYGYGYGNGYVNGEASAITEPA